MSIGKKISTISKSGIKPIIEGLKNKVTYNINIELEALRRAEICIKCDKIAEEPISWLKIRDNNIKEVSNKMCMDCGCSISLKIRQDLEICSKWKNISG